MDRSEDSPNVEFRVTLDWLWNLCQKNGWFRVQNQLVRPVVGTRQLNDKFDLEREESLLSYDNCLNEILLSDRIYVSSDDSCLDKLMPDIIEEKIANSNGLARGKGRGKKNMARLSLYNTGQHSMCVITRSKFSKRKIYGGSTKQIVSAAFEACEQVLIAAEMSKQLDPTSMPVLMQELTKLRRKTDSTTAWSKEPLEALIPMALRRYWRCELTNFRSDSATTNTLFSALPKIRNRIKNPTQESVPWLPIPVVVAAVVISRVLDGWGMLNVAQTATALVNVWCCRKLDVDSHTTAMIQSYKRRKDINLSIPEKLTESAETKKNINLLETLAQYCASVLFPGRTLLNPPERTKLLKSLSKRNLPCVKPMVRAAGECAKLVQDSANVESGSTKDRLPKGVMFVETVPLTEDETAARIHDYMGAYGLDQFRRILGSHGKRRNSLEFFMLNRLPYHQLAFTMETVYDELRDIVLRDELGLAGFPVLGGCVMMVNGGWLHIVRAILLFLHARVSSSRCSDDVPLFPIVAQWLFSVAGKQSANDLDDQEKILLSVGVRQLCCWFESNRSSRLLQALGSLSNIDSNAAFHAVKTIIYQWGWESRTDERPFVHPWLDWLKQTRPVPKKDTGGVKQRSRSVRDKVKSNVVSSVFELLRVGAQTDARLEWINGAHKTFLKYLLGCKEDFAPSNGQICWHENDWVWDDINHVDSMRFITGSNSWLSKAGRGELSMTLLPGNPVIQQKIWALVYDTRFPSCLRRYILNRTQIKRTHESLDKRGSRFSDKTLNAYNTCVSSAIFSECTPRKGPSRYEFIVRIPWTKTDTRNAILYSVTQVAQEGFRPRRQGSRKLNGPDTTSQLLENIERSELLAAGIVDPSTVKTRWHVHQTNTKGSKRVKQYQKDVFMYTSFGSNTALGKTKQEAEEDFDDDFVVGYADTTGAATDDEISTDSACESELMAYSEGDEDDENLRTTSFALLGIDDNTSRKENPTDGYESDDFLVQTGSQHTDSMTSYVDSNKHTGVNKRKYESLWDEDSDEALLEEDYETMDRGNQGRKLSEFAQNVYDKTGIVVESDENTASEDENTDSLGMAARMITRQLWEDQITNHGRESCDWRLDLNIPIADLNADEANGHTRLSIEDEKRLIVALCLMCERGGITKDREDRAWFEAHWPAKEFDSESFLNFPVVVDKEGPVDSKGSYSCRMYKNCLPVFRMHQRHSRIFGETASTLIPDLVEFYKDCIVNT